MQAASRMADGQWPWRDFGWAYGPGQPLAQLALGDSLLSWRVLRVAADATAAVLIWALVRDVRPRWALPAWLAGGHRRAAHEREPHRARARVLAGRRVPGHRAASRSGPACWPPWPRSGAPTWARSPRSPPPRCSLGERRNAEEEREAGRGSGAAGPGGARGGARRAGQRGPRRARAVRAVPRRGGAGHGVGRARRAGHARRGVLAAAVPRRVPGRRREGLPDVARAVRGAGRPGRGRDPAPSRSASSCSARARTIYFLSRADLEHAQGLLVVTAGLAAVMRPRWLLGAAVLAILIAVGVGKPRLGASQATGPRAVRARPGPARGGRGAHEHDRARPTPGPARRSRSTWRPAAATSSRSATRCCTASPTVRTCCAATCSCRPSRTSRQRSSPSSGRPARV